MSDEKGGPMTQEYEQAVELDPAERQAMTEMLTGPTAQAVVPRTTVVRDLSAVPKPETAALMHSPEIGQLVGALAIAQGAFETIERTREAKIASARANYGYQYETLADVIAATRKALSENGLVVMQFPYPGRQSLVLRTMLAHKSGEWIINDLQALTDGMDPRSVGSGITYLMRYARKAILGLAAEYDDDAEATAATQGPPPRAGQRLSEQPAKPQEPAPASNVGVVVALAPKGDGSIVTLDTGFKCATRDAELIEALRGHLDAKRKVELTVRPPKDPKYAPVLLEVALVKE